MNATRSRSATWLAFGILLWATRVSWMRETAPPELDPSWEQALAVALAHGLQFGKDVVFSFGPLGALDAGRFQPELWWPKLVLFELAFKGLLAWRWTRALAAVEPPILRATGATLLVVLPMGQDAWYFASIAMLALEALRAPTVDSAPAGPSHAEPGRARVPWLEYLLLATIALIKFPYGVAASFAACVIAWDRAVLPARADSKRFSGISAARALLAYLAALVAVWSACGQAPWNLPAYALASWDVASGYSEAQSRLGPEREVWLAVSWIVGASLLLSLSLVAAEERPARLRVAARATIVLAVSFLAFKAGFVDHGESIVSFFGFATLAPCLLAFDGSTTARRARLALVALLVACGVAGFGLRFGSLGQAAAISLASCGETLGRTLDGIPEIASRREELAARRESVAAEHELPRTRRAVGDASVDLIGSEQALLFLNDLRWRPRPVFQSYLTIAPSLARANGGFLVGSEAPRFAMVRFSTIDNRLPMMEDSGAWQALLAGYAPVLAEHDTLLLERDLAADVGRRLAGSIVLDRTFRLGEVIELEPLPGRALRVSLDVRYTPLGALRKLLFRAAPLQIDLQTNERMRSTYRALPGMLSGGVVLRPFCMGTQDWGRMYTHGLARRVTRFRLSVDEPYRSCFEPEVRLVVERCDDLLPSADPARAAALVFGGFPLAPASVVDADAPLALFVEGRDAALLHAPFELAFDLPAGASRVSALLGVPADAAALTSPITLRAELHADGSEPQTLLELALDPRGRPEDRAPRPLEIELPAAHAAGARLVLRAAAEPGPGAGAAQIWLADVAAR